MRKRMMIMIRLVDRLVLKIYQMKKFLGLVFLVFSLYLGVEKDFDYYFYFWLVDNYLDLVFCFDLEFEKYFYYF